MRLPIGRIGLLAMLTAGWAATSIGTSTRGSPAMVSEETRRFCVWCTFTFMNAASLIRICWTTDSGRVESVTFDERGHHAARLFVKDFAAKKAEYPNAYAVLNSTMHTDPMYAETTFNGTEVCLNHLGEEISRSQTTRVMHRMVM